jgi:hypothetical protein
LVEALDRIIGRADAVPRRAAARKKVEHTPAAEKAEAFRLWRHWLTTAVDEVRQREAVRSLAASHKLDLGELARELVMDWNEVRSIAADPLCTIGAHYPHAPGSGAITR